MNYCLKNIDPRTWRRLKVQALIEDKSIQDLLTKVIDNYVTSLPPLPGSLADYLGKS